MVGIPVSRVAQLVIGLCSALSMLKSALMIVLVSCAALRVMPQGFVQRIVEGDNILLIMIPRLWRYFMKGYRTFFQLISRFPLGTIMG